MAKIILICGKICAGKTTYAKKLMYELHAVRLNPDEIMKPLFGEFLGDKHEEILGKTLLYICKKAIEIYETGINVVVDFGFWQRHYREETNEIFARHHIKPEWHYVDVDAEQWTKNIEKRNHDVKLGLSSEYAVDEWILQKFNNPEDVPQRSEIDVWYKDE